MRRSAAGSDHRASAVERIGQDINREARRLPPLQPLIAFEAAARHLSFTAAADDLHITQPAVSQQIRQLEGRLGVTLFHRRSNQLELTTEGVELHATVAALLDGLSASVDRLGDKTARSQLWISVLPSFGSTWLARRVGDFSAHHPGIDLAIMSTVAPIDFRQEAADLAIRWGRGPWPGLHAELVLDELCFPVASPGFLEAYGPIDRPAVLRDLPLLHDLSHGQWPQWLREVGEDPSRFARGHRFGDASAMLRAAVEGQGVALARSCLVEGELRSGALIRLLEHAVPCELSYYLVCPSVRLALPKVRAFRAWLLDQAGKSVTSSEGSRPEKRPGRHR